MTPTWTAKQLKDAPAHVRAQIEAQIGKITANITLNKYGATICVNTSMPELAGVIFRSRLERQRAAELVLLQRSGQIEGLRFHPRTKLGPAGVSYTGDFAYHEGRDREVWEDTKGVITERFRVILQLWQAHGHCPLRIMRRDKGAIVMDREIRP